MLTGRPIISGLHPWGFGVKSNIMSIKALSLRWLDGGPVSCDRFEIAQNITWVRLTQPILPRI